MKKLDRYISRAFLVRFITVLAIIFGLYLVFDALRRIDQIQKSGIAQTLPMILMYYVYMMPSLMLDALPPLILIGAGLALVQMSRDRELTTLKASGVSLRRASLPILLATLPVVVISAWARNSIVPYCTRQSAMLEKDLDEKKAHTFLLKDAEFGYRLYVGEYDYAKGRMAHVYLIYLSPTGSVKTVIQADSATWSTEGIKLDKALEQQYGEAGSSPSKPRPVAEPLVKTSLTPYDFVQAKNEAMTMRMPTLSFSDLQRQIKLNPGVPYFHVMLNSRLAEPLVPFIFLLLGIPLLVGFERSMDSRLLGIIICFIVAGAFQVLSFICISMGNTGAMPPVLAAWLPHIVTGPAGVYLFATMRT